MYNRFRFVCTRPLNNPKANMNAMNKLKNEYKYFPFS